MWRILYYARTRGAGRGPSRLTCAREFLNWKRKEAMSSRQHAQWVDSVSSVILDVLMQWHEVAVADACPSGAPALEVQELCRLVKKLRTLFAQKRGDQTSPDELRLMMGESDACRSNYEQLVRRWSASSGATAHADSFVQISNGLMETLASARKQIGDIVQHHTSNALYVVGAVFDLATESVQAVHATIRDLRDKQKDSCERGFKRLLADETQCTRQCGDLRATWSVLQRTLADLLRQIAADVNSKALHQYATRVLTAIDAINSTQEAPGDCAARARYFVESVGSLRDLLTCLHQDGPKSRARCVKSQRRISAIGADIAKLERRTAKLKLAIEQSRRRGGIMRERTGLQTLEMELARERELDELNRSIDRRRDEQATLTETLGGLKVRARDADVAAAHIRSIPPLLEKLDEFKARSEAYQLSCEKIDAIKAEIQTATDAVCHKAACETAKEARRRFRSVYESARTQYRTTNKDLASRVEEHLKYYSQQAWQKMGVAQELLTSGAVDASGFAILSAIRADDASEIRTRSAIHGADAWILADAFLESKDGAPGPVFRLTEMYEDDSLNSGGDSSSDSEIGEINGALGQNPPRHPHRDSVHRQSRSMQMRRLVPPADSGSDSGSDSSPESSPDSGPGTAADSVSV